MGELTFLQRRVLEMINDADVLFNPSAWRKQINRLCKLGLLQETESRLLSLTEKGRATLTQEPGQ